MSVADALFVPATFVATSVYRPASPNVAAGNVNDGVVDPAIAVPSFCH
jgi:hypothetical protein